MIPDRRLPQGTEILSRGSLFCHPRAGQPGRRGTRHSRLPVLEVVEEDVEALRLDTVLLDDDARAADDLARVALAVDLAEASPGAENLGVADLDEVNLVLGAQRLDELDVLSLRAGLDEDAEVGLTLIEGLGALAETAGETVMDEGVLQDLLQNLRTFKTLLCSRTLVYAPEGRPRQKACPWGPRWKPRPQPRGRRLEFHLQRQTSCTNSTSLSISALCESAE